MKLHRRHDKKNYVLLVIIFALAYFFASPYIATYRLYKAAKNGDGNTVSEFVDFPSLRQSMKEQLNVRMAEKMNDDEKLKDNPFSMLGMMLADSLVSKFIDMYVTPAGVTKIIEMSRASQNRDGKINKISLATLTDMEMRWVTTSKFSVVARRNVEFVMRRNGIEWKLSEIVIPHDDMSNMLQSAHNN